MNAERDWFKEESDFYKTIKQAKEAVWKARMMASEIAFESKETLEQEAYDAYNLTQCAYELLDTAKKLMIIFYEKKGG